MKINPHFKRFGPEPRPVDTFAYRNKEAEAEANRLHKLHGNHPPKEKLVAYRVSDGLPITFTHPVDYVTALQTGRFVKELSDIKESPAEVIEETEPINSEGVDLVIEGVEKYEK